jgi:hypothetical protein
MVARPDVAPPRSRLVLTAALLTGAAVALTIGIYARVHSPALRRERPPGHHRGERPRSRRRHGRIGAGPPGRRVERELIVPWDTVSTTQPWVYST